MYSDLLYHLQCVQIKEDLLKTMAGSMQSDALTSLSNLNFA